MYKYYNNVIYDNICFIHYTLYTLHIYLYLLCIHLIGIMRGWLPSSYLADCLNKDIVAHIPTIPGFLVYFAESRYAYYECVYMCVYILL